MQNRKEAWLTTKAREWELRHQAFDGAYAVDQTVRWYVLTPKDGIGGASEADAVVDFGAGPIPVMDGDEPVKSRTPSGTSCLAYELDDDGVFQPKVVVDDEGGIQLVRYDVYNWSVNGISGNAFMRTEVVGGRHFLVNAECPPPPDEGE
ncbi:hypothetical protein [Paludisphaera borealis]|uniref:Uncharacterized protein n=1 Tax=Paludisphaera borealis TaxID=1387353 RepID=A0A1U7CXB9_9BACT|nr:hypothetical protein [Paludisphaera borealis]APW63546.1 hypothetical protein BSF38_05118 [Paludisphaera borealis]